VSDRARSSAIALGALGRAARAKKISVESMGSLQKQLLCSQTRAKSRGKHNNRARFHRRDAATGRTRSALSDHVGKSMQEKTIAALTLLGPKHLLVQVAKSGALLFRSRSRHCC